MSWIASHFYSTHDFFNNILLIFFTCDQSNVCPTIGLICLLGIVFLEIHAKTGPTKDYQRGERGDLLNNLFKTAPFQLDRSESSLLQTKKDLSNKPQGNRRVSIAPQ